MTQPCNMVNLLNPSKSYSLKNLSNFSTWGKLLHAMCCVCFTSKLHPTVAYCSMHIESLAPKGNSFYYRQPV